MAQRRNKKKSVSEKTLHHLHGALSFLLGLDPELTRPGYTRESEWVMMRGRWREAALELERILGIGASKPAPKSGLEG